MAGYVASLIMCAAVIYGLERNRRLQSAVPSRLAGSSDIHDRDAERTRAELRARRGRPAPGI